MKERTNEPRLEIGWEEVANLAAQGCTNAEIARRLDCSLNMVTRRLAEAKENGYEIPDRRPEGFIPAKNLNSHLVKALRKHMSLSDVCRLLEISPPTVKWHLQKAEENPGGSIATGEDLVAAVDQVLEAMWQRIDRAERALKPFAAKQYEEINGGVYLSAYFDRDEVEAARRALGVDKGENHSARPAGTGSKNDG